MKALNQNPLPGQLIRKRADHLRIITQAVSIPVQNPIKRPTKLLVSAVAARYVTIQLRRHTYGWHLSRVPQSMLFTPIMHLLMVRAPQELVHRLIIVVSHPRRVLCFCIVQRIQMFKQIVAIASCKSGRQARRPWHCPEQSDLIREHPLYRCPEILAKL
ncbi:hypothetical protein D3C78_1467360 [compost metagenome]